MCVGGRMDMDKAGQCNVSVQTPRVNSEPVNMSPTLEAVIYRFWTKDQHFLSKLKPNVCSCEALACSGHLEKAGGDNVQESRHSNSKWCLPSLTTGAPLWLRLRDPVLGLYTEDRGLSYLKDYLHFSSHPTQHVFLHLIWAILQVRMLLSELLFKEV